jgi:sulfatase modifying factor 1
MVVIIFPHIRRVAVSNTFKSGKKATVLFLMAFVLALFSPNATWAFEKTLTNSLGMEFVLLPAGTFTMGSPPDEPGRERNEVVHTAKISRPFYLQTTEVTVKQWRDIMGKPFFGRKKGSDDMPVVRVSWQDCIKFIKKLNKRNDGVYRLPTEAEWEYACRAGNTNTYGIGNSIDCNNAMYANNTLKTADCVNAVESKGLPADQPAPVKSYAPNALGLYDMQGNVWEWCEDWYRPYKPDVAVKAQAQGEKPSIETGTDKVRRGGSWYGTGPRCRCANRNYSHFANRYQTTGFRLVREAE